MVVTHTLQIATRGQGDTHDITERVAAAVGESGVTSGTATVFVVGSRRAGRTTGITCGGATTTGRATSAPRCSGRR